MTNRADRFIHEQAECLPGQIGMGTSVLAFVRLDPTACIGENCCIFSDVFIDKYVTIGSDVVIKYGAKVLDGVIVGDNSVIGAHVKIYGATSEPGNDRKTIIGKGVSLGDGVEVLAGVRVGDGAVVGADVVLTASVPPGAIMTGNPAKVVGYTRDTAPVAESDSDADVLREVQTTSVAGVTLHNLHNVQDKRGNLSMGEFGRNIPFMVSRYFLVYNVPAGEVRGDHAHFRCHQFLVAVKGTVHVIADDGVNREEFVLDRADKGLHLPPMTWGIQHKYSADAVLLVLASDYYDNEDYVRSYEEFISHVSLNLGAPGV
ncbi:WxcM-like domain-containing protein [Pseudomonas sp. ANT_J12]|uniref:WxcM-like domain-containing protein n=1 Tax=Pseudomonas sp. ANT_J12 TaxID=2597351 RepID=UPI002114BCA4|nr:WxcM-like domain-containing protein [Pseudomonas sp. ANT_J12]